MRVEIQVLEKTHRVEKYLWENPKHRKYFTEFRVKTFPTVVIASEKKTYSRTTGYRTHLYIKRMKGADLAIKSKDARRRYRGKHILHGTTGSR